MTFDMMTLRITGFIATLGIMFNTREAFYVVLSMLTLLMSTLGGVNGGIVFPVITPSV